MPSIRSTETIEYFPTLYIYIILFNVYFGPLSSPCRLNTYSRKIPFLGKTFVLPLGYVGAYESPARRSRRPRALFLFLLSSCPPSFLRFVGSSSFLPTLLSTGHSPRRLRTARRPPPRSLSPPGIGLGRPMRPATGPHALRLLGATGSHRAFPCHIVVGVVVFRTFYNATRRAVPSARPRRG